ncbi:hypothetical protein [Marinobacter sp. CA1]|uniref:hypothetical protein n=1 Tax=Marinobacter sp. CA1 TaxID=2817656 RepID=UPI001D089B5B|nr:hypothetical protein [Marinobacter sp. CA1]UDL05995.1 hypothetical protein J2887_04305 [Marinobacter sp. CA1]
MELQSITLNVPFDLPDEDWDKIMAVYREMDGWIEGKDFPYWYGIEGDAQFILVSAEPSGLVFSGNVNHDFWIAWITKICAKLSLALNREVHDATA